MRIPKLHFTKRKLNKQRFILSLSIITYAAFALFAVSTIHSNIKANQKVQNQIAEYHRLKNNLNISIVNCKKYENEEQEVVKQLSDLENQANKFKEKINNAPVFKVTAYDLSKHCTGKVPSDKSYGITSRGINVRDKTWESARLVAIDPNIIPYGTKIYISFIDNKFKVYNGVYVSGDCGSGVNGKHLDFFMGDFHSIKVSKQAKEFGIRYAKVIILD